MSILSKLKTIVAGGILSPIDDIVIGATVVGKTVVDSELGLPNEGCIIFLSKFTLHDIPREMRLTDVINGDFRIEMWNMGGRARNPFILVARRDEREDFFALYASEEPIHPGEVRALGWLEDRAMTLETLLAHANIPVADSVIVEFSCGWWVRDVEARVNDRIWWHVNIVS